VLGFNIQNKEKSVKKFGRLTALLSILLTTTLTLGACGGDNSTATPPPAPTTAASGGGSAATGGGKTVTVTESDFQFSPNAITINVGDTIMFVNKGGTTHTATASDASWDSGSMDVNATFSHTFTAAGTVAYYCKFHGTAAGKGMAGTITVVAGSSAGSTGSTGAPAATATTASVAPAAVVPVAGSTPGGAGAAVSIQVQDYQFSPKAATANVGDTVTWTNAGAVAHTITAGDGSWDSGNFDPGKSYSHTFTAAGTVSYYCRYHGSASGSGMSGTITVAQGSSGSTGGATSTMTATMVMTGGFMTGAPDAVVADNQPAGSTVLVKHIHSNQNGFIVIHANTADNKPGAQLGHTAVKEGDNDNVVVQVSPATNAGDKVWPMLHIDAGVIGTYEFPGPDAPVIINGNIVMQQITITAASAVAPSVTANDQPAGSSITVAKVIATQDGWITVHANTTANQPGDQLGHTQIKAGENDNLVVQVSPAPKAGDKVWPMLHIDAGVIGTYEFPGPDAPVIVNGNIMLQQITITAAPAVMPSVTASNQPAGSSITVTKVIAAQDGWITVHANTAANQPGDQLGHTLVKKGENDNVVVQLSPTPKVGDKVWPMLHIDAGVIGTYEFPGPDAPVIVNGNIVMQQITLTAAPLVVQELDNHFSATDITINVGDTILFVNNGTRTHTATAGNGSWDSGDLVPGASFSHTFNTLGVFTVYCKYHGSATGSGMAAAITVVAGPTPTP
jgi:plastocyanin